MKKMMRASKWMLMVIFMAMSATVVKAQDCGRTVDLLCKSFTLMTKEVDKCTSLEDVMNLNYDKALDSLGGDDIPDSCMQYVLTKDDKIRVKSSVNKFFDAMIDKLNSLAMGLVSREALEQEMLPTRKAFDKAVDNAVTFQDLTDNLSNLN